MQSYVTGTNLADFGCTGSTGLPKTHKQKQTNKQARLQTFQKVVNQIFQTAILFAAKAYFCKIHCGGVFGVL